MLKLILALLLVLVVSSSCARAGKYDELGESVTRAIESQRVYMEELETIQDAKEFAAAVNKLSAAMERFKAEVDAFLAKHPEHPELYSGGDLPAEVKEIFRRIETHKSDSEALHIATKNAFAKYNSSPAAVKALARFNAAAGP